jgi:hypothetical protein
VEMLINYDCWWCDWSSGADGRTCDTISWHRETRVKGRRNKWWKGGTNRWKEWARWKLRPRNPGMES